MGNSASPGVPIRFIGSNPKHRPWKLVISWGTDEHFTQKYLWGRLGSAELVYVYQWDLDINPNVPILSGLSVEDGLNIIQVYRDWWEKISG